jgi:hypothetical protein
LLQCNRAELAPPAWMQIARVTEWDLTGKTGLPWAIDCVRSEGHIPRASWRTGMSCPCMWRY